MEHRYRNASGAFFLFTLIVCVILAGIGILLSVFCGENNVSAIAEPALALSDGWTMTDSDGQTCALTLPETIPYSPGLTLSIRLPDTGGSLSTPVFVFYSNYVSFTVRLEGQELYAFPIVPGRFSGATGNTYHFVRLPADYAGKTLTVFVQGELGNDITYLLNPPVLGSKAGILMRGMLRSLPSMLLAAFMTILALGLGILYSIFHKRQKMNRTLLYTALFALLFGVYVCFESSVMQMLMPNGYLLCFCTLSLLALLPIPLIGVFLDAVSRRFVPLMLGLMALCGVNLLVQLALNFTGGLSVRAALPMTHAVILISISVAIPCLYFSDRSSRPQARRVLLSAVPMILGGAADIVLLNLNLPSMNNCFWFAVGVSIFITYQICGSVRRYFTFYRSAVEAQLFSDMAYSDALTGVGNRNAYERRLSELGDTPAAPGLCCAVMDLNNMKHINDTLGHQAGDTALSLIGALLREHMPVAAGCFRTGGDEFVVLLEGSDEQAMQALAQRIQQEAARQGDACGVPLRLAVGAGEYRPTDATVLNFVRRVDTLMYECKRQQKNASGSKNCARTQASLL